MSNLIKSSVKNYVYTVSSRSKNCWTAGLPPQQVRAMAVRQGKRTPLAGRTPQIWGWVWLEGLIEDSRYSLRQLRKEVGFTAVAVLTLALGIGANAAVFALLYAVILKPLPVPNPQEAV